MYEFSRGCCISRKFGTDEIAECAVRRHTRDRAGEVYGPLLEVWARLKKGKYIKEYDMYHEIGRPLPAQMNSELAVLGCERINCHNGLNSVRRNRRLRWWRQRGRWRREPPDYLAPVSACVCRHCSVAPP